MTSVDTFISVSNYLAAPILIGAGLTIDGLITWSQASANNTSRVAKEKPVLLAMVLLGVAVLVGSLEVALIATLDPQRRLPVRWSFFLPSSSRSGRCRPASTDPPLVVPCCCRNTSPRGS